MLISIRAIHLTPPPTRYGMRVSPGLRSGGRRCVRFSDLLNQCRHIVPLVFNLGLACRTIPGALMHMLVPAALQNRLDTALIAICTNCMRGFSFLFSFFKNVAENPRYMSLSS